MPKEIAGTQNPAYTDWKREAAGSYGTVYTARQSATGREVAIKEFRIGDDDDSLVRDAVAEISVLRSLSNPHIISVLDVFEAGNSYYMVMPQMECTLHDYIKQVVADAETFDPLLIKSYMQQLLSGVGYLHALNILHRDLKPQNLLIDGDGLLQICDFGLTIEIEADRTQQTALCRYVCCDLSC